jgi:hypothetical protein
MAIPGAGVMLQSGQQDAPTGCCEARAILVASAGALPPRATGSSRRPHTSEAPPEETALENHGESNHRRCQERHHDEAALGQD